MEEKQYIDRAVDFVSKDLSIQSKTVRTVVELLDEGNTVPFIARYRKEQTGNLDETQIQSIKESFDYQIQLDQRKEEIIRLIDEQGKLTDELKKTSRQQTSYNVWKTCIDHINKKTDTRNNR